jgi:hypothetical protein
MLLTAEDGAQASPKRGQIARMIDVRGFWILLFFGRSN